VPVPEGTRIVACPFCEMRSLVKGDRGVRRWHVSNRVEQEQVLKAVTGYFSGISKARDLKRAAQIKESFLVYVPYWQVNAIVAGWLFGRVKSGDKNTKPVEIEVLEEMTWNDAAVDVAEFGVHRVSVDNLKLEPYNSEQLHSDAMVFEPVESRSDALQEAKQHFAFRGRSKRRLKRKYFEKFHILRHRLSIVYFPLWVVRYQYRSRSYQVVVEGLKGDVLYGKAPGNIFYRAAMLVGGMAIGNLLLVNGTIVAGLALSASDDGDSIAFILAPLAIGIGLIIAGYRKFRYGEEVETIDKRARKASLSDDSKLKDFLPEGLGFLEDLSGFDPSKL